MVSGSNPFQLYFPQGEEIHYLFSPRRTNREAWSQREEGPGQISISEKLLSVEKKATFVC